MVQPKSIIFISLISKKETMGKDKKMAGDFNLVRKTKARELAKSLKMKISADSFPELDKRIADILKKAARKAQAEKRKTILRRDVEKQPDLFEA